jgi:uncharacterized damage-inducible protein DinB
MANSDRNRFIAEWERESCGTVKVMQSLPAGKYDFRAIPDGRSLGELAWHLAEIENVMTYAVEIGKLDMANRPPGIERPRTIEGIAPGYEQMHRGAVARVEKLSPEDLDREVDFLGRQRLKARHILWVALLHHQIHHRGQLVLMCRMAGGVPPGLFGPTREESAALRAARAEK